MASNNEAQRPQRVIANFLEKLNQLPKSLWVTFIFLILVCVAAIDLLIGNEISCTVFYPVAASLATWYVGASFGIIISILSAISTSAINSVSGERYSNRFAPVWDAAIAFSFYLIMVWLLRSLRSTRETLEQRVEERTASLSTELAERRRERFLRSLPWT